jgi:transglutaminase/protease-like cytokinesis protein 3
MFLYCRYEYDDHYFLTDPREFIYEFFPLQPEWQLLKNPITLTDFEELPFVRSLFFRYGLYFQDRNTKAVMYTDQTGTYQHCITCSCQVVSYNSIVI